MGLQLENLILRSPLFVRSLAANWMAFVIDRARRGSNWDWYLQENDFARYYSLSGEEKQRIQEARLGELIAVARKNVPFYRRQFSDAPEISSVVDLRQLPRMSKSQAREAGEDLLNEETRHTEKYFLQHTSGTTGTPFSYRDSHHSLRTKFAMRDCFYKLHGFEFTNLSLRLGGRLFMATERKKPPFWLRDYVRNQLLFSLYHMNEASLKSFVPILIKLNPRGVTGYPSSIYTFARFCESEGIDWKPSAVFSDSETVLDIHREKARSIWGVEIHDLYGNEAGILAGQCLEGNYHTCPMTSVFELLDEDGQEVAEGEIGEITITDLQNQHMPFIRYRTGDSALWSTKPCGCGWGGRTLQRIEGRIDDFIVLPDGTKIGRLDHIFKNTRAILECQIVQERRDYFRFLLVPDEGYDQSVEEELLRAAYDRLGSDVHIKVEKIEEVPRTSRRKFRSVISHLNEAHD